MINRNFRFLALLLVLGLLSLFTGCNLADKDVNPTEQRNNPVIATNDKVQVKPGSGVIIDLFKNDQITTSSSVTLLKDYLKKGTAEFIQQGVVLYTPKDSTGTDTLAYTICPPGQPCDTGAVAIFIGPNVSDTAQGAMPDFVTTTPGQSVGIDVLKNDKFSDSTSQDSSTRVVDIVQSPNFGSTNVGNGYYVTYTPNQDFQGTDRFVYGVRNANANNYLGYAVVTVTVKDSTNNGCTIKAVDDHYTLNKDSIAANGQHFYFDVLANDSLCSPNTQYEIVGAYANLSPSFVNGKLQIFLNRPTNTGDSISVIYKLIRGTQTSQAKVSIGFTGDVSICAVAANDDMYTVNQDSLSQNGTYIYVNALANDELCNTQATPIIINNGGFNDVSFVNGQLKVKMFATDQAGTYTVRYALKENGISKSEANISIQVNGTAGCTIASADDQFNIRQDTLSQNGTYVYINVLANDEVCNTQVTPIVVDNGGFNDVSFVNNHLRIRLYLTDPKRTYTVRYALKENGSVRSESDVKITIQ